MPEADILSLPSDVKQMLTTVSELVSHSIAVQQPPDGLYPLLPWELLQHLGAHLEVQLTAIGVAIGSNTPVLPPPQSFIWPLVALFQLLSSGICNEHLRHVAL